MAYGLHFGDAIAGRVFYQAATPLGLAIPIYTATSVGGGIPLWNPPNSNRNVEVISVDLPTASGTAVYGVIGFMGLPLQAIATAALCTALANTTPMNAMMGSGNASRCLSSNAGTTTVTAGVATPPTSQGVAAPGWVRSLGEINGEGAAAGLHGPLVPHFDLQGTMIVPPGWMVYLACTLATVALIGTTLVWKEIPIVPGQG
jgi:hypothetical protein